MNTSKYFIFIRSKNTFDIAKKYISLNFVWNKLFGAGWAAEVAFTRAELNNLKIKLWNCKYQLLKVK